VKSVKVFIFLLKPSWKPSSLPENLKKSHQIKGKKQVSMTKLTGATCMPTGTTPND
jgi:hypothetical protein